MSGLCVMAQSASAIAWGIKVAASSVGSYSTRGWYLGIGSASHESVTFEVAQRQGKHPLRDAGNALL